MRLLFRSGLEIEDLSLKGGLEGRVPAQGRRVKRLLAPSLCRWESQSFDSEFSCRRPILRSIVRAACRTV